MARERCGGRWKSECFEKEGMTLHILVSLDGWMDRISDL